ncbi:hypothetical protein [Methylogaea oryzae]|uniref:Uncharacterized protein n=2 Tax=Methylogaea oryzae TaxID=1295382 RepID=A0A8D5AIT1_9GAMM|nr:hypothetical protein [Methylogaea oryzae]BBL70064.1 hypothetical protein MoryE10_06700 [Methylogaea oryzae]
MGGLVRREWIFSVPMNNRDQNTGATLVVTFLVALVVVSVLLALFARLLLSHYEAQAAAAAPAAKPRVAVLNQEAEQLQKKVVDLVSGSIEGKLQAIESSIQHGQVTAADLQALDELRQELRILASYGANSQAVVADPMMIRGGIPTAAAAAPEESGGFDGLAFAKNLFYFSIASVSVAGLLVGSYWLYCARRQRRLPPGFVGTRPLITRGRSFTVDDR